MRKRTMRNILFSMLISAAALSFGGCGLIADSLSSVRGTILDARSYSVTPLPGATVTLTSVSDSSYQKVDTTDSSGEFYFSGLATGEAPFVVTASYPNYFIPPVRVNQNGFSLDIGNIPALRLSTSDWYGLSFITVWNSNGSYLDLHMTFPSSDPSGALDTKFQTPTSDPLSGTRTDVYWYAPYFPTSGSYSSATVYLNQRYGQVSTGVQTTTLRTIPYTYTPGSYTPYTHSMDSSNDVNGLYRAFGSILPYSTTFRYMGAAEVYLYSPNGTLTNSAGSSSNPDISVYCIQTLPDGYGGAKGSLIAKFTLPQEISINSASIARVNMFLTDSGGRRNRIPDSPGSARHSGGARQHRHLPVNCRELAANLRRGGKVTAESLGALT